MNEFDYLHSMGTCNVDKIEGTSSNVRPEGTCGVGYSKYLGSSWRTNDIKIFEDYKRTWYNEGEISEHKGENDMSLVGLFKCGNGIVAFGDYKSTEGLNFFLTEEKNRETKKVFKNNKFVFVTFGPNEILINNSKIRLENYINSILKENTSCEEFFNGFANYTSMSNIIYNFLVGKKGEDGLYYIYDVKVCKGKIEFYVTNSYIICGGDAKYYNVMLSLSIDFTKGVDEVAPKIEKAIKSLIEFYSVEDVYQTVGTNNKGEILIEIFK